MIKSRRKNQLQIARDYQQITQPPTFLFDLDQYNKNKTKNLELILWLKRGEWGQNFPLTKVEE
jgi:hypothetical protein